MPGRLFLVPNTLDFGATPAGPAADLGVTLPHHVIATAARLGFWVAEDARTTRAFLKRVDAVVPLAQPLQSIRIEELPRRQKGARTGNDVPHAPLLAPAVDGHDIGLISEAGLPAVADPGALLVAAAHAAGISVMPLSGPSSLMLALSASGLNGQSFAFTGYLPIDSTERAARIGALELQSRRQAQTQLLIETPYRNEALLAALISSLQPATRLSVSCGLTLDSGWTRSAPVSRWRATAMSIAKDIPAVFCFLAS